MMNYKEITLTPRTDFENIPPMEPLVLWEKGFEGNNFTDSSFTGFATEGGELFMYPEVPMGKLGSKDVLPVVAWSPIKPLEEKEDQITMKPCEKFKELYKKLEEQASSITPLNPKEAYVSGKIGKYPFRMFQEVNPEAIKESRQDFKDEDYLAWVGIRDERANGSTWPALYTPQEIDEWVKSKEADPLTVLSDVDITLEEWKKKIDLLIEIHGKEARMYTDAGFNNVELKVRKVNGN